VRSIRRVQQLRAAHRRSLVAHQQGPLAAAERPGSSVPERRGSRAVALPVRPVQALRAVALRVQALRVDRWQAAPLMAAPSPAALVHLVRVALEQRCGPMQAPRRAGACDATAPAAEDLQRKTSRCRPQNKKHMGCVHRAETASAPIFAERGSITETRRHPRDVVQSSPPRSRFGH